MAWAGEPGLHFFEHFPISLSFYLRFQHMSVSVIICMGTIFGSWEGDKS